MPHATHLPLPPRRPTRLAIELVCATRTLFPRACFNTELVDLMAPRSPRPRRRPPLHAILSGVDHARAPDDIQAEVAPAVSKRPISATVADTAQTLRFADTPARFQHYFACAAAQAGRRFAAVTYLYARLVSRSRKPEVAIAYRSAEITADYRRQRTGAGF